MGKLRLGIVVGIMGALLALVAVGCGGSDDDEAQTPTSAPTITNSTGTTETTATTETTETTETTATTGAPPAAGGGDVAAGKTFFEGPGTCQGCHLAGGTQAGAGPVLAGSGLTEEKIRSQITNGGGIMPAGLAKGTDLDNVTAWLLSIQ